MSISRGRTRSMGATSHLDKPTSISSSSSATSLTTFDESKNTDHFASTSVDIQREPLVEKAKAVRFSDIDLRDVTAATNIEHQHLDPVRDGVLARMRQAMLRNAAPVMVGAAIGGAAGGYAAANGFELFNNTIFARSSTTPASLKTVNSNGDDDVNSILIDMN